MSLIGTGQNLQSDAATVEFTVAAASHVNFLQQATSKLAIFVSVRLVFDRNNECHAARAAKTCGDWRERSIIQIKHSYNTGSVGG
jgi:hypothetical protein